MTWKLCHIWEHDLAQAKSIGKVMKQEEEGSAKKCLMHLFMSLLQLSQTMSQEIQLDHSESQCFGESATQVQPGRLSAAPAIAWLICFNIYIYIYTHNYILGPVHPLLGLSN